MIDIRKFVLLGALPVLLATTVFLGEPDSQLARAADATTDTAPDIKFDFQTPPQSSDLHDKIASLMHQKKTVIRISFVPTIDSLPPDVAAWLKKIQDDKNEIRVHDSSTNTKSIWLDAVATFLQSLFGALIDALTSIINHRIGSLGDDAINYNALVSGSKGAAGTFCFSRVEFYLKNSDEWTATASSSVDIKDKPVDIQAKTQIALCN